MQSNLQKLFIHQMLHLAVVFIATVSIWFESNTSVARDLFK